MLREGSGPACRCIRARKPSGARVVVCAALLLLAGPAAAVAAPFTQARLTGSGGQAGASIAVSGDGSTVAAGAPSAGAGRGAVYVFTAPAGGWAAQSPTAVLTVPGGAAGDRLGWSVSVSADGSVVVASAPFAADGGTQRGAVYVFTRPPAGWSGGITPATLTASAPADNDELGSALAVSGDGSTVVAGEANTNAGRGAVLLFARPGAGWADGSEFRKLTVTGGAVSDRLGASVAVSADGSTVVAGAPGADSARGAAYVFERGIVATGWQDPAKLTASDGAPGDALGTSVAAAGGVLAAGAPDAQIGSRAGNGAVYVFVKPPVKTVLGNWTSTTERAKLAAANGAAHDALGWSVALSGDGSVLAVGAPTTTSLAVAGQGPGSAYVFARTAPDWSSNRLAAQLIASGGAAGDAGGWSLGMSAAGMIVAGAPRASGLQGAADAFTATTTTTVDCLPVLVTAGQPANCTATVTDSGSGAITPSGSVGFATDSPGSFAAGAACTLAPTATAGSASCSVGYTPSATGSGAHEVSGSYGGDEAHTASRGTGAVAVVPARTTASVTCRPPAVAVGLAGTCSVTVGDDSAGVPPPGGTVTFTTDSAGSFADEGACTLAAGSGAGTSSCRVGYTPRAVGGFGRHAITARYGGDGGHTASVGLASLRVVRAPMSASLRCRSRSLVFGRRTVCTATVREADSGLSTATGRVFFSVRGGGRFRSHRSCRLRRGRPGLAACRITFTPAGRHSGRRTVTAGYRGDANHLAAHAATVIKVRAHARRRQRTTRPGGGAP